MRIRKLAIEDLENAEVEPNVKPNIAPEKNSFEDIFGIDDMDQWKKDHVVVSRSVPQQRNTTMELYRGFDYLAEDYILTPEKSEQGLIWFTHNLITRSIDPIEYAASHGKYFVKYPLDVIKHYQTIQYANGDSREIIPKEIEDQTNSFENCSFYMGYELPEGWVFTYKTEKFIGCSTSIQIDPSMIQKSSDVIDSMKEELDF